MQFAWFDNDTAVCCVLSKGNQTLRLCKRDVGKIAIPFCFVYSVQMEMKRPIIPRLLILISCKYYFNL